MLKKKEVLRFGVFLFFISLSIGIISANTCSVKSSCSVEEFPLMGLSTETNAHGELVSEANYNYFLCCDFGSGDTTCDGSGDNKIVGLSSDTNAHAEIPENNNYGSDVCYKDLICVSLDDSCSEDYPIEMLSLSADTNAFRG